VSAQNSSSHATLLFVSQGCQAYETSSNACLPPHSNESYGWHFQYLTIIGLSLASLTFITGALADITLSPQLFLVKNLLSVCSAPLECLISALYWGLSAIDRKLLVPEEFELPLLPDLGFHAIPSILLVVDLLLLSPPWTITALPAIGLSAAIAFAYWFWIELCYQNNGWYPYPLFDLLDTTQRIGLFSASALLMAASTAVLKWLYGRINGYGARTTPHARPGNVKSP